MNKQCKKEQLEELRKLIFERPQSLLMANKNWQKARKIIKTLIC